jgi:hypothetical protein
MVVARCLATLIAGRTRNKRKAMEFFKLMDMEEMQDVWRNGNSQIKCG